MKNVPRLFTLFSLTALGVLHGFSSGNHWSHLHEWANGFVQIICLAGLARCLIVRSMKNSTPQTLYGGIAGFSFGFGWLIAGVGWVYVSMHVYGQMNMIFAGAAAVLFASFLALFLASATALWSRIAGRNQSADSLAAPLLFACLITLSELLRGYLFTGFPWASPGYSHTQSPLAVWVPWLGVYGVTFIAAFIAGVIANASAISIATKQPRRIVAFLVVTIVVVLVSPGIIPQPDLQPTKTARLTLIQPAIEQSLKFQPDKIVQNMKQLVSEIAESKSPVVILPETAWPVTFERTPDEVHEALRAQLANSQRQVALGLPFYERNQSGAIVYRANSVVWLERPEDVGGVDRPSLSKTPRYDKSHLVPFGEFIPLGFRWFVDLMVMPLGDFSRGPNDQAPFKTALDNGGLSLAFNICYEDLFGEELVAHAANADVLVNISNLAWFGKSQAISQHLEIARIRAMETGRPMLRATNTGSTAHIDHTGKVVKLLPPFVQGQLDVEVTGMRGQTGYSRWTNWPVFLFAIFGVAAVSLLWRRPLNR